MPDTVPEEIELTEVMQRLEKLENGQKSHSEKIDTLEKRVGDCEESIDALA